MTPAKRERLDVILNKEDLTNLNRHMSKSFQVNDSNNDLMQLDEQSEKELSEYVE